jgi:hypothetical protein
MNNDIKMFQIYQAIATKFNLDSSDIDGDEMAQMFSIEELVILQKEVTKAIARKVMG